MGESSKVDEAWRCQARSMEHGGVKQGLRIEYDDGAWGVKEGRGPMRCETAEIRPIKHSFDHISSGKVAARRLARAVRLGGLGLGIGPGAPQGGVRVRVRVRHCN